MIRIGTSGWSYDHWQGRFYPEQLSAEKRLEHYCRFFSTAEINNSFYNLPSEKTLRAWYETAPDDFIFAAKASRFITHMKKLKDPEDSTAKFFDRITALDDKLGPILFQLPPNWGVDVQRLENLLEALPSEFRYGFEFRDTSWYDNEVYELLEKYNAAFCIYDLEGHVSPKKITSDLIYIRLHGPDCAYQGSYDKQALSGWAGALSNWDSRDREIYCYFDNDQNGYAAQNAQQLSDMLK